MKIKTLFLFIISCFLAMFATCTSCTKPESNVFAKYAVNTGIAVAEDAGVFKNRVFVLKQHFKGDTLLYYKGINTYFIQKTDTAYILYFTPNVKNIKDTINHFLTKKRPQNE